MKKTISLLLALIVAASASADVKILERSAKKAPDWITGSAEGYLVAAVEAPSIADARPRAEQDIAGQITMAVARNVATSYSNNSTEIATNDGVDSRDEFTSKLAVEGANLPFLKGISLSNAQEIYWVKVQDKSTKAVYYQYYVKYPFSRQELATMIKEFEEYDADKEAELAQLEADIDNVDSVDGINDATGRLKALGQYFFDNVRRQRTSSLLSRYQSLIKQVVMNGSFNAPRTLTVSLSLNGRPFRGSGVGKATSNCASDIQVNTERDGTYRVTFNSDYCLDDEENYIEFNTTVGNNRLKGKYIIPSATATAGRASTFAIVPTGTILLTAGEADPDTRTLTDIGIRISLDNKGGLPFGVKSIELNVPTLRIPIVIDNIDDVYTSKGIVQLKLTYEGTIAATDRRTSAVKLVNGTITVVNPDTEAVERVRVALPYTANWE